LASSWMTVCHRWYESRATLTSDDGGRGTRIEATPARPAERILKRVSHDQLRGPGGSLSG